MSNRYVTRIDDLEFFQGDTVTLEFEFYYDEATPIDLIDMKAEVLWTLCPYGQYDYPVLTKRMMISDQEHHVATVTLNVDETKELGDIKFSQQPILRIDKREYRRAEGDIVLNPRIRYEVGDILAP